MTLEADPPRIVSIVVGGVTLSFNRTKAGKFFGVVKGTRTVTKAVAEGQSLAAVLLEVMRIAGAEIWSDEPMLQAAHLSGRLVQKWEDTYEVRRA